MKPWKAGTGINDNGQIVGYYTTNGVDHGFLAT
jgi:probable HAF family extracellular repeat protein